MKLKNHFCHFNGMTSARPTLRDIYAKFRLHKALLFMPLLHMRPLFGGAFMLLVSYKL